MKRSLSCAVILFSLLTPGISSAATVLDLRTFHVALGSTPGETNFAQSFSPGSSSVDAQLFGTADIFSDVEDVVSFEWRFLADDPVNNDFAYVINVDNFTMLADVASVRGSGGDTGWNTFEFDVPVTGLFKLAVANVGDGTHGSMLEVRNVLAVPEPETYAMLLAGLLLISFSVRLNERRLCS